MDIYGGKTETLFVSRKALEDFLDGLLVDADISTEEALRPRTGGEKNGKVATDKRKAVRIGERTYKAFLKVGEALDLTTKRSGRVNLVEAIDVASILALALLKVIEAEDDVSPNVDVYHQLVDGRGFNPKLVVPLERVRHAISDAEFSKRAQYGQFAKEIFELVYNPDHYEKVVLVPKKEVGQVDSDSGEM